MSDSPRWNAYVRSLHWLTLMLLIVAATTGFWAHDLPTGPAKLNLFASHKSFGLTILFLLCLRIIARAATSPATPINRLSTRQRRAASFGHGTLYLLLLLLPLSGWLLTSLANFPFRWFDLFQVPMLVAADPDKQELAKEMHEIFFWLLVVLLAGHVLMVVKHHRQGVPVAQRMLSIRLAPAVFLGGILLLAMAIILWALASAKVLGGAPSVDLIDTLALQEDTSVVSNVSTQAPGAHLAKANELTSIQGDLPWRSVSDKSTLQFIGDYLGTEFVGNFKRFDVRMDFDPEHPDTAAIEVDIDITSASTGSADMDEMLPDPVWFHFSDYAVSGYRATGAVPAKASDTLAEVAAKPSGFHAEGALNLKGRQQPVAISFTWQELPGDRAHMSVEATINRRAFGIGSGEWAEDDSIGFAVKIRSAVTLQKLNR